MNKKKKNSGFTLVELIIVIAILGVLMAVLIPQYIQYVEKARAGVCSSNCAQQERMLNMEIYTGADASKLPKTVSFTDSKLCPSGGTVVASLLDGIYAVNCDKHGTIKYTPPEHHEREFAKLLKECQGMTPDELKKKIGYSWLSNDNLRKYYLKQLGGSWEKVTINGTVYDIQPYADLNGSGASGDIMIYAKTGDGYYVDKIYNPEDGKWYSGGGISIANWSWEKVKATMEKNKWKPVEATYG